MVNKLVDTMPVDFFDLRGRHRLCFHGCLTCLQRVWDLGGIRYRQIPLPKYRVSKVGGRCKLKRWFDTFVQMLIKSLCNIRLDLFGREFYTYD